MPRKCKNKKLIRRFRLQKFFPVAERDGVAVDARTRIAGGDGEPRLQVAGVEDGELLHERDDYDAAVHGDVGDLGIELDVVYLEICI